MDIKPYILNRLLETFSEKESQSLVSILFEDLPDIKSWSEEKIDLMVDRIVEGEPIQYITGVAPFYGYFFNVNKHVLIPRPETEELVFTIEKYIKENGMETCKILDVGTGSGCIPITLSKLFPKAEIYGLDISGTAVKVARSNKKKLAAHVDFLEIDILNESSWGFLDAFDIIVSNPPYIPNEEKALMAPNVLDYEPHLALFVSNQDALLFYRKIYELAEHVSKNAAIFLECNEFNAEQVVEIFSPTYETAIIKDLQQKDRIVKALPKIN